MRVAWLKDLRMADVEQVGGKNASLGEMIGNLAAAGIRVPGGFATTAQAYREFLGELGPRIDERLRALNPEEWTRSRSAARRCVPGSQAGLPGRA